MPETIQVSVSERMGNLMLKSNLKIMMESIQVVLARIETLVVIKKAVGTKKMKLRQITQNEEFRTTAI